MTEEELKLKYCRKCINSDGNSDCIAKQEILFDQFVCDSGEMFEKDDCNISSTLDNE